MTDATPPSREPVPTYAHQQDHSWRRTIVALVIAVPLTAIVCLVPTLSSASSAISAWQEEVDLRDASIDELEFSLSIAEDDLRMAEDDLRDCRQIALDWSDTFILLATSYRDELNGNDYGSFASFNQAIDQASSIAQC